MLSNQSLKLILYAMILTITSLLMSLSMCPEEPENNNDPDTTSHDFLWQLDTLGTYSSYLNDVWIVDENNIWVVGYIRVDDPDSSFDGTGRETFNAARWDGEKWNLMLIHNASPLNSIFYFNENDIWVSSGFPKHWNGNQWTMYHLQNMGFVDVSVEHIWGTSSSNLYFVGYNGSIVRYNGSTFTKIESGTTLPINDIWGAYNSKTKQYEVLAVASDLALGAGRKVLKITGNQVAAVVDSGLPRSLSSIYFVPGEKYCIAGDGYYESKGSTSDNWELWPTGRATYCYSRIVRGNGINDIFVAGDYGEISHYNGSTWMNYRSQVGYEVGGASNYYSIAIKENLVIAVGEQGIVAIGRR